MQRSREIPPVRGRKVKMETDIIDTNTRTSRKCIKRMVITTLHMPTEFSRDTGDIKRPKLTF